jgi:hypothetical protein
MVQSLRCPVPFFAGRIADPDLNRIRNHFSCWDPDSVVEIPNPSLKIGQFKHQQRYGTTLFKCVLTFSS